MDKTESKMVSKVVAAIIKGGRCKTRREAIDILTVKGAAKYLAEHKWWSAKARKSRKARKPARKPAASQAAAANPAIPRS